MSIKILRFYTYLFILHINNIIKEEQFIYTYKIEENNTNMFSINCKFYENDNLLENYTSTPLKKPDSIEDIYFVNNKIFTNLV